VLGFRTRGSFVVGLLQAGFSNATTKARAVFFQFPTIPVLRKEVLKSKCLGARSNRSDSPPRRFAACHCCQQENGSNRTLRLICSFYRERVIQAGKDVRKTERGIRC
jgi:hypothetical protein